MAKRKILRITNRFNLGGPTLNVGYLSKYMDDSYETLLVGGMKDESEDSSEFIVEKLGIQPVIISEMKREINFKNDKIALQKLKQIIADYKPDIVHTHASKAGALGRLAAFQMKVPFVFHTFHGHVFHSYFGKVKTLVFKNVERYLALKSTAIIAISDIQKQELCEQHTICSSDKTKVIPLGFDLSKFQENTITKRASFRDKYKLQDDEIAIGIVGRLVPVKNHELFIDLIKSVSEKTTKKIRTFIIGDGESKLSIKNYAKQQNVTYSDKIEDKLLITFTSWIRDIDVAYAGLDLVILTSHNEGTPVSLIEAQAAGKPIVTVNVGGINNVVKNNDTGFVCEKKLTPLSEKLLQLIENDDLRKRMGANGWQHVYQKFSYKRLVDDMKNLYDSYY